MWFFLLLVLAIAAFFIIKAVKSQSNGNTADSAQVSSDSAQAGSLGHDKATSPDPASQADSDTETAATVGTTAAAAATTVSHSAPSPVTGAGQTLALQTGDQLSDIREMIKILNLAEPDAGRLGISGEQLMALRSGQTGGDLPSDDTQGEVAEKLRHMLA